MLSPVSSEVSSAEAPLTTTPSVASFSPGRATNSSPTRSAPTGTRRSTPSTSTVASRAPSSSSARTAAPARRFARASAYRPASRNAITTAATSKYRWCPPEPGSGSNEKSIRMPTMPAPPNSRAQTLHAYAVSVPSDTSVSIVLAPCRALASAAAWNGAPAQSTTGVASTSSTHCQ
jgi:hypothetical protein